ncbi:MAG: sulfatase-like hydrolase/transferase [Pirellulales bacterium]|nr:sulfatase-like hydrolase/transferase [Pirellulales bacterium]
MKTLIRAVAIVWLLIGQTFAQPNIVMIVSDDAGYADFGFQDQLTSEVLTPNLDALAMQSIVFRQGYVTGPTCSTSRVGMLTGLYQDRIGVAHNFVSTGSTTDGMPTDVQIMPERLKELGYATGAIGKWHLGTSVDRQPQSRGFDTFWGFHEGSRPYFLENGNKIRDDTGGTLAWTGLPSFNGISPDPVRGRHLTDAFADEASRFIATHAGVTPFFLNVEFNSPHSPYDLAKQQDLDLYPGMPDDTRKNVAALMSGMDRGVGEIMARLNDPNRDSDTSDSVADNTIVVFMNDNGGRVPVGGIENHDNSPLRGHKGQAREGGIRVPFIMKAPGVTAGVFDEAVSAADLFPTFVAAAGGSMTTPTDGVDLMPYLTGTQTGQVHDKLFWRVAGGAVAWAVRKGDWKLEKGTARRDIQLFQLNADGTGEEDVDELTTQFPAKFDELLEDYIDWEVEMQKPTWSDASSAPSNRFDEFRYVGSGNWTGVNAWENNQNPGEIVTLQQWDGYADAVFAFDAGAYSVTNNIVRASGPNAVFSSPAVEGLMEMMLNELRLEGTVAGTAALTGTGLLFTETRAGAGAKVRLDGTGSASFDVSMDLLMYDDLEITGDGDGQFVLGDIRSLFGSRTVTKTGTSTVEIGSVDGDYDQQSGTLRAVLGDTLDVTGTASLGGSLEFDLDGQVPSFGDKHTILVANAIVSDFDTISAPGLPASLAVSTVVTGGLYELEFVNNPDLNNDGWVDSLDLGTMLGNFGQMTNQAGGGLDGATPVDSVDLGLLLGAWSPRPLAATVPEPASMLLALAAASVAAFRRYGGTNTMRETKSNL